MLSRNAIRLVVPLGTLILVGAVPGLSEWMGLRPALSQASSQTRGRRSVPPRHIRGRKSNPRSR